MAKQKKKRNKQYTGTEASVTKPTVTRISAVHRGPLKQWWHDKKRIAKPVMIAIAVAVVVVWLLFELIRAIAG